MKIKNAIIFAAGMGTRMSPVTNFCPKPLIKIFDEPLIEKNIKLLKKHQINEIYIVVGYLKEQFNYLIEKYQVKLIENPYFAITNNISSLVVSKDIFGDTLYLEGDIFLKEDIFPHLFATIEKNYYQSTMFGLNNLDNIEEWVFEIDKNNQVLSHHLSKNAQNQFIWSGLMFIDQKMAQEIKLKVNLFFNQEQNKQKYFEQFLWLLDNKFLFQAIDKSALAELDNYDDLVKIDKSYLSHQSHFLFTPGPTNVIFELEEIIAKGLVHHRSNLYEYYFEKLVKNLQLVFQTTKALPIVMSNSTTGAMEATVANLIDEQDKVLLINIGDFGQRFKEILDIYKADITELKYPYGQSYNLEDVEKALKTTNYKALFITLLETSNGVLQDLKSLAKLLTQYPETLFIVDSVSAILEVDLNFDQYNIDVAYAATAKSFGLPPGLAAVALSEKAQKMTYQTKNKRFYFDFRRYIEYYNNTKQSPFTPSVNLVIAWIYSIEIIKNISLNKIRQNKSVIYKYLENEFKKLGFVNFVQPQNQIHSLLVMIAPKDIDVNLMKKIIAANTKFYFEVGRAEMANKMMRIGISITTTMDHAIAFIDQVKKYINKIDQGTTNEE